MMPISPLSVGRSVGGFEGMGKVRYVNNPTIPIGDAAGERVNGRPMLPKNDVLSLASI